MNLIKKIKAVQNEIEETYKAENKINAKRPLAFRVFQHTVNPFLVQGGKKEAVYQNKCVYVPSHKDKLEFVDFIDGVTDELLKDGDELYLILKRDGFYATKKVDTDEYEQKEAEARKIRQKRNTLILDLRYYEDKLEQEAFWNQYDIPFKFQVDIKTVLSGLSESSNGDGCQSNTKYHIVLNEDTTIGRTKRTKGQFLCTQPKGRHYYNFREKDTYSGNIITCAECLKKIEKFKKV